MLEMKYTLLEMTQKILSSLDSDEVDSIADTVEAGQVAEIVEQVYMNLLSEFDLPPQETMFTLEQWEDTTMPVVMTRPTDVIGIDWIKYDQILTGDTNTVPALITPLGNLEFFNMQDQLNTDNTEVDTIDFISLQTTDPIEIKYYNDRSPSYYTVLEDSYIIFDALDTAVDADQLLKVKSTAYGKIEPVFTQADSTTFSINEQTFSLFLNECKSMAFFELKQVQSPNTERHTRRGRILLEKKKRSTPNHRSELDRLPNYGKTPRR